MAVPLVLRPFAVLLLEQLHHRENTHSSANPDARWLITGQRAQPRPPSENNYGVLGFPVRTARSAALRQLVLQAPAPVIVHALGLHDRILQRLGVPDAHIYLDHGLTGSNRARPGLGQARAAVRSGDLLVPKLDRLARSVRDIGDTLVARGVKLSLGGSIYAALPARPRYTSTSPRPTSTVRPSSAGGRSRWPAARSSERSRS